MNNGTHCIRTLLIVALLGLVTAAGPELRAQEQENSEFKMAVGLYNDGMYDLALAQFRRFIDAYPSGSQATEARFYLGSAQEKLGRFDDARATFQSFALTYPDNARAAEAWTKVGDAFLAMGNDHEAALAYERVRLFHPKSPFAPAALLKAGEIESRLGDDQAALKAFQSLLQDYPGSRQVPDARIGLGKYYASRGDPERAEREIRLVVQGEVSAAVKAEALCTLGSLEASLGLPDTAEALFRTVISSYPKTPAAARAEFESGKLSLSGHNYDAAIEHFRKAIAGQSVPESLRTAALFETGKAYFLKRDFVNARSTLEKYLRDTSRQHSVSAVVLAARAALDGGNSAGALRLLQPVLAQPPSHATAPAWQLAGRAAAASGRYRDASQYLTSLAESLPDDPSAPVILCDLARMYERNLNDDEQAAGVYRDIIRKYPRSPQIVTVMADLGGLLERSGKAAEALQVYSNALGMYPANDLYDTLSARIAAITDYRVLDPESTLRMLAAVVGETVTDSSRALVQYRLGTIYSDGLKDYASASRQYEASIRNGLDATLLPDASWRLAVALTRLGTRDTARRTAAVSAWDAFTAKFPDDPRAADAAYQRLRLQSIGAAPGYLALQSGEFLKRYAASTHGSDARLMLASAASAQGDTSGAIRSLDSVITDPKSPLKADALLRKGDLLSASGKPDEAYQCWETAAGLPLTDAAPLRAEWNCISSIRSDTPSAAMIPRLQRIVQDFYYTSFAAKASELLPQALAAAGEYDKAIAAFTESEQIRAAIPLPGDQPRGSRLVALSGIYESKGDERKAVELYRSALLEDRTGPGAIRAFTALGRISQAAGNKSLAAEYLTQAAKLGGTPTGAVADLLFQSDQYDEAARQYTVLAVSANPAGLRRYYHARSIISMLRGGRLPEANRAIEEFSSLYSPADSERAQFQYEKGLNAYRAQDYPGARKLFGTVAGDYPSTPQGPWAAYYLGKIAELNNAPADAADAYEKLLHNSPSSDVIPRALLSLGNMHYNAERYEQAVKYYREIVKTPDRAGDVLPFAMNNLIQAYQSLKVYDAALTTARDFVTRYPDDESVPDKKITIGSLYTKLGYYDQAVTHFRTLLNETGGGMEAEIRYDIGEALYNKGDYQGAILEFLKVPYLTSRAGPVNWTATSLYMAGQSYEKLSKFDEAVSMYRQITERTGIDATFKAAARKEIDRVQAIINNNGK